MNGVSAFTAWLDLPPVAGRSALRAGLIAMQVLPAVLPADRHGPNSPLRGLADHPDHVVFIDISRFTHPPSLTLAELDAVMARDASRSRVFLLRLASGHVSDADRRWVRSLGFADLLPEFDASDCEGSLRSTLDAVARAVSLPRLTPAELAQYARVLNDERDGATPRATIRTLTGLSAEALAATLSQSLAIEDRDYLFRTYAQCFVGSKAVAWMARHFRRTQIEAVALGQALGALGLLVHVTHDHPFGDVPYFFRLAHSDVVDRIDLGVALDRLREPDGLPVLSRSYLGKIYDRCWIGADAVSHLCAHFGLARHEAWMVLHRLMQFGLIEHVTQARPMIDGAYFYRWIGLPDGGSTP